MLRLISVSALVLALAACSSTPPVAAPVTPAPTPLAPVAAAPVVSAPAPAATPQPAPTAAPTATPLVVATPPAPLAPHLDPASDISRKRSVFFDFDQFVIREQDRPVVELQGKYLASSADLKVAVEGNADERGSSEYNLALGNKRAQAVVQALKLLGVRETQIEATSYGAERPLATGHDEAAWAQNRRADIRYR